MSLPVLLILVLGGIGSIALMMHLLGHSRPFDLAHAGVARAQWARHWPEDQVGHVYLANSSLELHSI